MYSKLNSIIESYIKQENTDYAYMLDGVWGRGKTYYIQNELKRIIIKKIKKDTFNFYYVSLNGIDDLNKIQQKVALRLFYKQDENSGVDIELLESCFKIGSSLPLLNKITKPIENIKKFSEYKFIKQSNFKNKFIVFDDLERISDKINIKDVLGLIFDHYVSKGAKVLIVCDESEILKKCKDKTEKNKYLAVKEKIIRRTVKYNPEFKNIILNFLNTKYRELEIDERKINLVEISNINNLRTLSFVFDIYSQILNENDKIRSEKKLRDILFENILVFTDEFKKGHLNQATKVNYKNIFTNLGYLGTKTNENESEILFFNKYVIKYNLNIKYIEPLIEVIITGDLDTEALYDETVSLFNLAEHNKILDELRNYSSYEADELSKKLDDLKKYLAEGAYFIEDLFSVFTIYTQIITDDYLTNYDYELDTIFLKAVDESSKNPDKIPPRTFHYDRSLGVGLNKETSKAFHYMKKKIIEIMDKKNSKVDIEYVKNFFKDINNAPTIDKRMNFINRHVHSSIFKIIANIEKQDLFLTLNNRGLTIIEAILQRAVILNHEIHLTHYDQKESMEFIYKDLNKKIEKHNFPDQMRKRKFKEMLDTLEKAIDKINMKENQ
ncbi:MAG: hypothetical protein ACQESP_13250 [Candidatus Muiribacteriota bacterium]